ncbi:MAG TPA: hypothetical protein PK640_02525 [Verrucomicrobiota bacterium]|nr:hypothetical protein [Verrucomicrobiota bacterium]
MNRFLHRLNLLGVCVLALLCVGQWRVNRRLNLEWNRQEQLRLEQAASREEQAGIIAGQAADLAALRAHLERVTGESDQAAARLAAAEEELRQAVDARARLEASVSNWAAAVTVRDERLRQAASQLETVIAERNEAVRRHNDLTERYNTLVKQIEAQ